VPVQPPPKKQQRMSLDIALVADEDVPAAAAAAEEEGTQHQQQLKKKRAKSLGSAPVETEQPAEHQKQQEKEEQKKEDRVAIERRQPTPFPARPHNPIAAAFVAATKEKQQQQQQQQPQPGAVEAVGDNAKPRRLRDGLIVQDVLLGTGPRPTHGKRVFVKYVGRLSNGTIFDKTAGKPFSFRIGLGEVIKGWDIGLAGMRVGGKRKLTIPPNLGYGARGAGPDIPPNATLHFDAELVGAQSLSCATLAPPLFTTTTRHKQLPSPSPNHCERMSEREGEQKTNSAHKKKQHRQGNCGQSA